MTGEVWRVAYGSNVHAARLACCLAVAGPWTEAAVGALTAGTDRVPG